MVGARADRGPQDRAGCSTLGAAVHVVAPDRRRRGPGLGGRRALSPSSARPFVAADLDGAWLVTAATADPAVNAAVADAGEARRVWVNSADDPANCSFTLMSVVRRADLVVTVGTGGRSPALATYLTDARHRGARPRVRGPARPALREPGKRLPGRAFERDADWQRAFDSGIVDLVRAGRVDRSEGAAPSSCL